MTARISRRHRFEASPETVWSFIADPAQRAAAISVVDRFEDTDAGYRWHVRLPIPLVNQTIAVDTEDVVIDPPRHVEFIGRSPAFAVRGVHDVEPIDATHTALDTEFIVDGKLPGVERFFRQNLDQELQHLAASLRAVISTQ
jgi:carbon monoxide dehydrogenase subunit G